MTKTQQQWRNRIVGHGEMPASEFLANPLNWRIHPQFQQEAMAGALNEIGWIDEVTVNTRTGRIVDGHLRVTLALRAGDNTPVPYKEVDLSEEEEALALASKDPIAALAVTDNAQYLALLDGVSSGEAALQQLLDQVAGMEAAVPDIEFKEYDESVENDVKYCTCPSCGHKFPQ